MNIHIDSNRTQGRTQKKYFTEANYKHKLINKACHIAKQNLKSMASGSEVYCKIQNMSAGVLGILSRKFSKISSLKLNLASIWQEINLLATLSFYAQNTVNISPSSHSLVSNSNHVITHTTVSRPAKRIHGPRENHNMWGPCI